MNVLVQFSDISKRYGATLAVDDVNLVVSEGEIIGLLGANGAGKSTLMGILSGSRTADSGSIVINNKNIATDKYTSAIAKANGVKMVYQELSLCGNLRVYENFFLEKHKEYKSLHWRKHLIKDAKTCLNNVFPQNTIDVTKPLSQLSLSEKQMVEIARAMSTKDLKLLVLDEPTSSLGFRESQQLLEYCRKLKQQKTAVIFITHRISEIMSVADNFKVLVNGKKVGDFKSGEIEEHALIDLMSGADTHKEKTNKQHKVVQKNKNVYFDVKNLHSKNLSNINFKAYGGEIIGISGLEGSGQRDFLAQLYFARQVFSKHIKSKGKKVFVAGDRKREGILPSLSIQENIQIQTVSGFSFFSLINLKTLKNEAKKFFDYLGVVAQSIKISISALSGGNQQKVLMARALMAEPDIMLLDDPTKGVDISTKKQMYETLKAEALKGKLVLWYSTDDEEFEICSRVVVFRYGTIVGELKEKEINKDAIVKKSFEGESLLVREGKQQKKIKKGLFNAFIPLMAMVFVFSLSGILQRDVFSFFGIDLLIGGAIPLVFATFAQMYILGLSHVDLGIGAFMGLINVVSATWLVKNPVVGFAFIIILMCLYSCMSLVTYYQKIPAIITTLSMSFIWVGVAYIIQPRPGGEAPMWLTNFFEMSVPVVPLSVLIVLFGVVVSFFVYRSGFGTILRALGNNPNAITKSGFSQVVIFFCAYFIASIFATLGGLFITAQTYAADINATTSYTLLTVASVVIGGGSLIGGIVSPFGVLFGAITLSMIGSLLGFLNISSEYVSLMQGVLLLGALVLRLLKKQEQR